MTRQHNQQYKCINCGCWTTAESSFGRWIRNNPNLDSSKGYCIVDQDYWIHKFMIDGSRKHQLMMWVEIKTMGSELSDAQRDTLYKVDHIFKRNGCKEPLLVNSVRNGKVDRSATTYLHVFGIHILRFSGLGPDDSDQIWWDKHPEPIDEEMLTRILSFEVDPHDITKEFVLSKPKESNVVSLPVDKAANTRRGLQ